MADSVDCPRLVETAQKERCREVASGEPRVLLMVVAMVASLLLPQWLASTNPYPHVLVCVMVSCRIPPCQ